MKAKKISSIILILCIGVIPMVFSQTYKGAVFADKSEYILTEIDENNNMKEINSTSRWIKEGVQIVSFTTYYNSRIYFTCYTNKTNRKGYYDTVIDLIINDGENEKIIYSKKESNNFWISFSKIVGQNLFFTYSDEPNNLYSILLNHNNDVKIYTTNIGSISNLWLNNSNDLGYLYSIDNSETTKSGVGRISMNSFELIEENKYNIQDFYNNVKIISDENQNLFFIDNFGNKEQVILPKKITGKVFALFILDNNSLFIGTYEEKKDFILNFLFDSSGSNKVKTYKYFNVTINDKKEFQVKDVNGTKKTWQLLSFTY